MQAFETALDEKRDRRKVQRNMAKSDKASPLTSSKPVVASPLDDAAPADGMVADMVTETQDMVTEVQDCKEEVKKLLAENQALRQSLAVFVGGYGDVSKATEETKQQHQERSNIRTSLPSSRVPLPTTGTTYGT